MRKGYVKGELVTVHDQVALMTKPIQFRFTRADGTTGTAFEKDIVWQKRETWTRGEHIAWMMRNFSYQKPFKQEFPASVDEAFNDKDQP